MAFIPFEETRAQSTANSPALGPAGTPTLAATAAGQQQSASEKAAADQKREIFRLYAPGQEEHLEGQETRHEDSFPPAIILRGPSAAKQQ
ncbi:uncharacterized protein SAPINGB_P000054 [Magnusiomyces paraingens]|uniref:Uncharacterized protein n=1 Tax=Magnusiomyces paraingens TaxID=2606893 RepID=A0A5E8B2J4_9ASCO|nr:uncharacterized protein SAPINGB_P000054 [Saprochaete ingens]VVT43595.1 unnamed protein product [Saprochaete ingens]